jgi:hypothetical protein
VPVVRPDLHAGSFDALGGQAQLAQSFVLRGLAGQQVLNRPGF